MRATLLAAVALSVFLVALAPGQEPPVPPVEALRPPAPPTASNPDAVALLDRAVAHQAPRELTEPGAIKDLTVRIGTRVWDHNQQPAQVISLGVTRFMVFGDPEKFRSEWRTSVDTQVQGFDGKRFWYTDKETNRFLLGDDTEKDRQAVREEMDETRHLVQFFFLANLKGPHVLLSLEADETIEQFDKKIPCRVILRHNVDPAKKEPPVRLWLGVADTALHKASALATDYGQKTLTFLFRYDESVQPRVKGVLVPFRLELWEQPFGAPLGRVAAVATLEEQGGIEFNTGLDPTLFLRPVPER